MESIIKLTSISKEYNETKEVDHILKNVDLEISKGEFVCIIGPSGCGKSTLLRILIGLVEASSGEVQVAAKERLAMVFQNFALFPWLNVRDNIAFGMQMAGESKPLITERTNDLIETMHLNGSEDKHPKELSGGMKQRVGIARALATKPSVLLMDEPFSALDALTARRLREDTLHLWKQDEMTVVMVTHLVEEAVQLADTIVVLSPRPGKVLKTIKVDLPRPRNLRSQAFYKYVDMLEDLLV